MDIFDRDITPLNRVALPELMAATQLDAGFIRECLPTNPWLTIDFVDERSPYGAVASDCRSRGLKYPRPGAYPWSLHTSARC